MGLIKCNFDSKLHKFLYVTLDSVTACLLIRFLMCKKQAVLIARNWACLEYTEYVSTTKFLMSRTGLQSNNTGSDGDFVGILKVCTDHKCICLLSQQPHPRCPLDVLTGRFVL